MKSRNSLTPAEEQVVAAEWMRPKGERPTQEDLALRFNVAPVTIRRALAEHGLIKLSSYKTKKETQLIEFLNSQGLDDLTKLTSFVVKSRKRMHGKQTSQNQA